MPKPNTPSLLSTLVLASCAGYCGGAPATPATEPPPGTTSCFTAVDNAIAWCTDTNIVIEATGLPAHTVMVGIAPGGWNSQWPEAQGYAGANAFQIPREPTLAAEPTIVVRNAAGVAANGIPIFLPQAPGRVGDLGCVDLDLPEGILADGDCLRDPVAVGEMDDCGGHTGRGNDYHYHGKPTCLLETLEPDAVAGFMLDGFPVYASPLPSSTPYATCGGYVAPDGTIHYGFTDTYPYVTNCLLGEFSEGPVTQGSPTYDGGYSKEELGSITSYFVDSDGCQHMEFSSGISLEYCG